MNQIHPRFPFTWWKPVQIKLNASCVLCSRLWGFKYTNFSQFLMWFSLLLKEHFRQPLKMSCIGFSSRSVCQINKHSPQWENRKKDEPWKVEDPGAIFVKLCINSEEKSQSPFCFICSEISLIDEFQLLLLIHLSNSKSEDNKRWRYFLIKLASSRRFFQRIWIH